MWNFIFVYLEMISTDSTQEDDHSENALVPDMIAWDILMGKRPLIPNTLPEKMLDAPLTSATLASVPPKNCILQPDMSTFTSAVVTTNTTKITRRENSIRTWEENLKERRSGSWWNCHFICMFWNLANLNIQAVWNLIRSTRGSQTLQGECGKWHALRSNNDAMWIFVKCNKGALRTKLSFCLLACC